MSKSTIVLLHGAFQNGENTWHKVRPLLENAGHKVIVVNLPGRDGDGTDPKTLTIDIYRDAVLKAMAAETASVVLVGHSFGGITISNVAETGPTKIKALVYLSAYMPQDGQSMLALAQTDRDSHLGKPGNLVLAPDYSVASIKDDQKADIFANDADEVDRSAIVSSLLSEPGSPQGMPVRLTEDNFGSVPNTTSKPPGISALVLPARGDDCAHQGGQGHQDRRRARGLHHPTRTCGRSHPRGRCKLTWSC